MTIRAESGLDFHGDLQRLLSAEDEATSRAGMIDAFVRRGAAGTVFFGAPPEEDATRSLIGVWGHDMSGDLGDVAALDVVQSIAHQMPSWLVHWFLRRKSALCFSRILRYLPISGEKLLRHSAPGGARPIADLVYVPYNANGHRHFLIVGFHHVIGARTYDEIVSLGLAYTVKWIAELAGRGTAGPAPRRLELTERELSCLQWLVAGKTLQEVATITEMSYSTVRYHVERAKERAGFATTQQLIAHAAIEYRLSAYGPSAAPPKADRPIEGR